MWKARIRNVRFGSPLWREKQIKRGRVASHYMALTRNVRKCEEQGEWWYRSIISAMCKSSACLLFLFVALGVNFIIMSTGEKCQKMRKRKNVMV